MSKTTAGRQSERGRLVSEGAQTHIGLSPAAATLTPPCQANNDEVATVKALLSGTMIGILMAGTPAVFAQRKDPGTPGGHILRQTPMTQPSSSFTSSRGSTEEDTRSTFGGRVGEAIGDSPITGLPNHIEHDGYRDPDPPTTIGVGVEVHY